MYCRLVGTALRVKPEVGFVIEAVYHQLHKAGLNLPVLDGLSDQMQAQFNVPLTFWRVHY